MNSAAVAISATDVTPKLRAYAVLEKFEMTGDIFFAHKAIYAAKAGANTFTDGELGAVQCRRAPWADEYAAVGVPAKVAVLHGWRFECSGCGREVDEYIDGSRGLKVGSIVGVMHSSIHCSAACRTRTLREERKRKVEERKAIEDFMDIVRARFPDAQFTDVQGEVRGQHANVTKPDKSGPWHREQVCVAFNFPGMEVGAAHFRMDGYHRIGPPVAGYTVYNGDRKAFDAYTAATKTVKET
jgi:hypothetical protein